MFTLCAGNHNNLHTVLFHFFHHTHTFQAVAHLQSNIWMLLSPSADPTFSYDRSRATLMQIHPPSSSQVEVSIQNIHGWWMISMEMGFMAAWHVKMEGGGRKEKKKKKKKKKGPMQFSLPALSGMVPTTVTPLPPGKQYYYADKNIKVNIRSTVYFCIDILHLLEK